MSKAQNLIKQLAERLAPRVMITVATRYDKETASQVTRAVAGVLEDSLDDLVCAAVDALAHVEELREAWRTGAIDERDGRGGLRSNRNVDVEVALRKALNGDGL